jgi:hypothetical protein
MDYELIVSALQRASAFDLYRLQSAVGHLLDDPLRLNAIKASSDPVWKSLILNRRRIV